MKYRVINEATWEEFVVEGASIGECQVKSDAECQTRGWSVWVMRSELLEARNG